MRHVTFIAGALLSLSFSSCSTHQTPPASDGEAKVAPEQPAASPDKKDGEDSRVVPVVLPGSQGAGASGSLGILSLPSEVRDPSADPDDYAIPSGPLPGEVPNGLRTPTLPDVLPLTLDGKINPAAASPSPVSTF